MGFDKKLKVTAICAVTLASNLVLAAEGRVVSKTGKARVHQAKRVPTKPVEVTESMVEKARVVEPGVTSDPILKQESIPVETMAPPFGIERYSRLVLAGLSQNSSACLSGIQHQFSKITSICLIVDAHVESVAIHPHQFDFFCINTP